MVIKDRIRKLMQQRSTVSSRYNRVRLGCCGQAFGAGAEPLEKLHAQSCSPAFIPTIRAVDVIFGGERDNKLSRHIGRAYVARILPSLLPCSDRVRGVLFGDPTRRAASRESAHLEEQPPDRPRGLGRVEVSRPDSIGKPMRSLRPCGSSCTVRHRLNTFILTHSPQRRNRGSRLVWRRRPGTFAAMLWGNSRLATIYGFRSPAVMTPGSRWRWPLRWGIVGRWAVTPATRFDVPSAEVRV